MLDGFEVRIAKTIVKGDRGEDRAAVQEQDTSTVVVVADGAGGTGSGSVAAEMTCAACMQAVAKPAPRTAQTWEEVLIEADLSVGRLANGGQSTAVVVEIVDGTVFGASVGDSGAWIVNENGVTDLTENQRRRPLIGFGGVGPVGFSISDFSGRLLVATDGLFKYARRARIAELVRQGTLEEAVSALIAEVRLPNGSYQDDIAIVLCEA